MGGVRDVNEDVFDRRVGEDESEEEEAEEVVAAIPGPLRKVPRVVFKLSRFGCLVLERVVRETEDEAAPSPVGGGMRGARHEGSGHSGERGGGAGHSSSCTGGRGPNGDGLTTPRGRSLG